MCNNEDVPPYTWEDRFAVSAICPVHDTLEAVNENLEYIRQKIQRQPLPTNTAYNPHN